MQIKYLHKNIYKLYDYARTQECFEIHRSFHQDRVSRWEKIKAEGVPEEGCQRLSGISRASYYRSKAMLKKLAMGIIPPSKARKKQNKPKWGEEDKQLVLSIRRENPTYGKFKIATILKRDFGKSYSISTVGRIIKFLKDKGLIQRSASCFRIKRKRNFQKGHAKPLQFKLYEKMALGENVQIDHMTITKNGISYKHFQAWERKSKFIHAEIFSNAKSSSARKFLQDLIAKAPFTIISIQVDGGSEFMDEFEEECAKLAIPLYVLPPASPKKNGGVERGNKIFREEFYEQSRLLADSIGEVRYELKKALLKYNTYRPHWNLKGLTPMEYIQNNLKEAA